MKIGVDIMGGDYAPDVTVLGAALAYDELPHDCRLVLFGDQERIYEILDKNNLDAGNFDIVHTTEVIGMGEHPLKSFKSKPDSSIVKGFEYLHVKEIDGFSSAGNTGAMMVGAVSTVKLIPGVIRPCIMATMPNEKGSTLLLDVGINPDCKPDVLYQYGILGSIYSKSVHHVKSPKVGLLNIGSEEEKGNLLTKGAHEMMKGTSDFNFIGNVEGTDLFNHDKVDVIVCDGFIGNVMLKQAEAFYNLIKRQKVDNSFFDRFNFENYGGTPVLGINSTVIIGHGVSGEVAIKNMILLTKDVVMADVSNKIKEIF